MSEKQMPERVTDEQGYQYVALESFEAAEAKVAEQTATIERLTKALRKLRYGLGNGRMPKRDALWIADEALNPQEPL